MALHFMVPGTLTHRTAARFRTAHAGFPLTPDPTTTTNDGHRTRFLGYVASCPAAALRTQDMTFRLQPTEHCWFWFMDGWVGTRTTHAHTRTRTHARFCSSGGVVNGRRHGCHLVRLFYSPDPVGHSVAILRWIILLPFVLLYILMDAVIFANAKIILLSSCHLA